MDTTKIIAVLFDFDGVIMDTETQYTCLLYTSFISRSLAEKIREGNSLESVIGKTLSVDRKEPMSIRGVFEAVSYTHLDVYKRQPRLCACST